MYIALGCACRCLLPVLPHPEQSEAGAKTQPTGVGPGVGGAHLLSRVDRQRPPRLSHLPEGVNCLPGSRMGPRRTCEQASARAFR